ncbi:OmpA family protein [Gangjinia marincola]|uniref:OmpA family protein n=1 Tax=Gangjinia marincola TaxID=578463 RepID=A0ABN1MEX8_9FLAO
MKKIYITLLSATLILGSCDSVRNANNTQKGGAIGATGGAVIGGVIGNNVGDGDNSVLGAIIGGVVGGAAGAYIGNRMDKEAKRIENEIPGAEVERVGEGISIVFDEKSGIYFDTNKSNINAESAQTLDKLVDIFKEYEKTKIIIDGHTDNVGAEEYNLTLSKKRATSVTDYLRSHGIDAGRLTTDWHGESQPKYDNSTPEGRSKNRRVEIGIVANEELIQEAEQKTN